MLPPTYVEGFHDLEAVKAMEYRTLGKTGLLVSKLSIGGAPFSCLYGLVLINNFNKQYNSGMYNYLKSEKTCHIFYTIRAFISLLL